MSKILKERWNRLAFGSNTITEHVGDEAHEHGEGSHQHEPHGGYVEGMALGFVDERMSFEEYIEFAKEYGYTDEEQLAEWWDSAIDQVKGSLIDRFGDGYGPGRYRNTPGR